MRQLLFKTLTGARRRRCTLDGTTSSAEQLNPGYPEGVNVKQRSVHWRKRKIKKREDQVLATLQQMRGTRLATIRHLEKKDRALVGQNCAC